MSFMVSRHPEFGRRRRALALTACALCFFTFLSPSISAKTDMSLVVDATDLPRKLLRSVLTLDLPDDTTSLLYPKWIPGIHGPRGPIQNVAGFVVENLSGQPIAWERDWSDPYRFLAYPDETGQHSVSMTYICNQPSTNSRAIDCYGYPEQGIIDWNCVTVYPEKIPIADIQVDLTLVLPSGWQFGTALPVENQRGDTVHFQSVTFQELVDMPLICGPYFRTVEFATTSMARYYLHMAAADATGLPRHDSLIVPFTRLAHEAEAMFGRTHFEEYHLLVVMSDTIPYIGLEHRNSSLNAVDADDFQSETWLKSDLAYVVPHELCHAWCGKYRRPVGMDTPDYQVDKRMDLLWVYEGLDTYLGDVLAARAGFIEPDDFKDELASSLGRLINQKGRQWRPLRDTEVANYTLRGDSESWGNLRRSQDYYSEGGKLWMDFDARIRDATNGEKSLDDFLAAFFSHGDPDAAMVPFDRDEVVRRLSELADEPWDSLINARTKLTQEQYNPEAVERCGYRLGFTDTKSGALEAYEEYREDKSFSESLGFRIKDDGTLNNVVPGGPAELAGLYDGAQVLGVDGMKYTYERLEHAIRNTPTTGKIILLTLQGETLKEVTVVYDAGLRYRTLIPVEGRRDWLSEIIAPRTDAD